MLLPRKIVVFIIVGLVLRLFLAAVSFHTDIVHFDLAGQILGKSNLLNFYDYTFKLDGQDQLLRSYPRELFNYPPATYIVLGSLIRTLTYFSDSTFHQNFLFNFAVTLGKPQIFLHLVLAKIPYLAFDFLIGYLFYNLFTDKKNKILSLVFWVFNPVNLYTTYMIGQFDIIPTFFVIWSLYLVMKAPTDSTEKRIYLSSLLLGIGGSFKIFPLLFLVPLLTLLNKWNERIICFLLGISVYLITILPFLGSKGFRITALATNQIFKSFYAQISISGGESIILFLALLGFFYLIFLFRSTNKDLLWQRFLIIILLFFSFTHYHPQWFLWLMPFLILEIIYTKFKHFFITILILISFTGLVFLFDTSLNIGLFSPLNPQLINVKSVWDLIGLKIDFNFMRSLFQTLFVASAAYLIYYYFPKRVE